MPGRKKGFLRSLTGRGAADEIVVGQRYGKQGAPWVVWEVASLFEGSDGMEYVQLVRVDDRTMRKTVSRAAVEHGSDFVRVAR
jgi:hypothetical protein